MYGSTSTKERKISIDSDVHLVNMDKNGGQGEGRTGFFQFEDPFDQEFWEKVREDSDESQIDFRPRNALWTFEGGGGGGGGEAFAQCHEL